MGLKVLANINIPDKGGNRAKRNPRKRPEVSGRRLLSKQKSGTQMKFSALAKFRNFPQYFEEFFEENQK